VEHNVIANNDVAIMRRQDEWWWTIEDTSIMSENKGTRWITESLLLAPPYDNDVSRKDNCIIKEALFEFLCSVKRTI